MSEQTFTVEAVTGSNDWNGKHGPMRTYKLQLKEHGAAEINQKPDTPAPKPGDEIVGTLEPSNGNFPPKLKRAAKGNFGGGGGRPKDPAERRSIQMQASQKVAVDALRLYAEVAADYHQPSNAGEFSEQLVWLANRLYEQVEKAANG